MRHSVPSHDLHARQAGDHGDETGEGERMSSKTCFILHATPGIVGKRGVQAVRVATACRVSRVSSRPQLSRRALITVLPLLALPRTTSGASIAQKPLSASLTPLINLQNTLSTLSAEIENGTNADIRRVVKTLLIGSDIPNNVREAVLYLPKERREEVLSWGRDAYEYLNQVIEYYDPVDVKARARGTVMAFCLEAVKKASAGVDEVVGAFGEEGAALRRALEQSLE